MPKPASPMRFPGSIAEVEASPAGPGVGAFFDLDGTLVAGYTGIALTQERIRRRDVGVGELLSMVLGGINLQLGIAEFEELIGAAAIGLRGRPLSDMEELGDRLFAQKIEARIYPEMRDLVRAHMARGHTVVLSSSALTIQVHPVARYLGIEHTLTNRFETDADGILTGQVVRPILWGSGKAVAVQQFAAANDIDLAQSYFYADGNEDVALMYLVGNPRPTNPGSKMAEIATKRGWPILRFTSRGSHGLTGQVRALAGFGSYVPAAVGGLAIGLATRNRRRGANFFMSTWPRMLLSASGVRLNVLGAENLGHQRPAVFIFNHRNNFDPLITASLIRDDWTGVAKKELASDPVSGALGRLVDTIYVDRDDTESAVESLRQAETLVEKGLSVMISPEGTRLDTTGVGPFKRGAFRMAMAAGIPIVPVVIRNAEVIGARDSSTIHPGTVDVAVFPPIAVDGWTSANLSRRIDEVRQLYLDTLADWPVDELPPPKKRTARTKS